MVIRFFLREPGNYHEIAKCDLTLVPRVGEYVIIDDVTREVRDVFWDINLGEIHINLRP